MLVGRHAQITVIFLVLKMAFFGPPRVHVIYCNLVTYVWCKITFSKYFQVFFFFLFFTVFLSDICSLFGLKSFVLCSSLVCSYFGFFLLIMSFKLPSQQEVNKIITFWVNFFLMCVNYARLYCFFFLLLCIKAFFDIIWVKK